MNGKQEKIEQLLKELTKDWTKEDWRDTNLHDLRHYIREWLDEGGDISSIIIAVVEFENYMGW